MTDDVVQQRWDSQLTKRPRELMDAMALKTVLEYSRGRPSRNASAAMTHTALTGVLVCTLSAWNTLERGTPRACAIARSTLNRQPHVST